MPHLGLDIETGMELLCLVGIMISLLALSMESWRDTVSFFMLWFLYYSLYQVIIVKWDGIIRLMEWKWEWMNEKWKKQNTGCDCWDEISEFYLILFSKNNGKMGWEKEKKRKKIDSGFCKYFFQWMIKKKKIIIIIQ